MSDELNGKTPDNCPSTNGEVNGPVGIFWYARIENICCFAPANGNPYPPLVHPDDPNSGWTRYSDA